MWPRFGIKIGNSTLCIAQIKDESTQPEVIANKQGDRVSQACILWDGNKEIECGLTAKQKMATLSKQAVANSFQLLQPTAELSAEQIAAASKQMPCEYDQQQHQLLLKSSKYDDSSDSYKNATRNISVYDVHVKLFGAELELAQQYLTEQQKQQKPIVVLSIPTYYASSSWALLAQAAEQAGFHVAQVVAEPTAALLAYGIGEEKSSSGSSFVMTVKCGGLFSHFALYEVQHGLYTQLATSGPFDIGGRQFTEALVQFITQEFQRKYKLDPYENRRSIAKIVNAAENCKHILTTLPSTQIFIDSLMDGVDFSAQMSRARFESLIQPVLNNFMQTLGECVDNWLQLHTAVQHINEVVLLGATMQIPKLQTAVANKFSHARVHCSLPANEVVAIGCARQAKYLIDPLAQELLATEECVCAQQQITLSATGQEENAIVLLEKGATLPSSTSLDLKVGELINSAAELQLRYGDAVTNVTLEDVCANENGYLHVEAEVKCSDEDNSKQKVQLIVSS